jgi:hypothetical protein
LLSALLTIIAVKERKNSKQKVTEVPVPIVPAE